MPDTKPTTAVVLVLGDVGRSPRMQYHALSLSQSNTSHVYLVGYRGERAVPAVEENAKITQVLISPDLLPKPRTRALYLLFLPLKAILLLFQVLWTLLFRLPRADVLLLQNPPAVPALAAAWFVRLLRGGTIVVDWHNLGFSMLSHALRPNHPFVRVSYLYEQIFGRLLDGHLCVTHSMAKWLQSEWGLKNVHVLHDRPPSFFKRVPLSEQHELFRKLKGQFVDSHGRPLWRLDGLATRNPVGASPWVNGRTPWTTISADGVEVSERPDRPMLLVSSTSWTADEDFGLLLEALTTLDAKLAKVTQKPVGDGPHVVAIITGKGPLKEYYEERMRSLGLTRVAICTMWLEPEDYPRLLGSADLGVCLHTSTSGLDLPMKVLDMYGCGLPVCAYDFECLHELVTHEENGLVFKSADELSKQLHSLLAPSKKAASALKKLREGVAAAEASRPRWAENWEKEAAPLLLRPGSVATAFFRSLASTVIFMVLGAVAMSFLYLR